MTFFGKERGDHHTHEHAHESPMVMLIPLGVLALGAVFSGMLWYNSFFGDHAKVLSFFGMPESHAEASETPAAETPAADHATPAAPATEGHAVTESHAPLGAIYMGPGDEVMNEAHHAPAWVKVSPFVAMVLGFAVAWLFYIKNTSLPARLANAQPGLYRFLLNKWYFDELYNAIFVKPAQCLGKFLWKKGDGGTIDGAINGVAMGIVPSLTRLAGRMQSGYLFHYAFAMVIGIVVLLFWVVLTGGSH